MPKHETRTTVTRMNLLTDTEKLSMDDDRYEEIYKVSYRVAFKLLGHREASEDVAIETIARLIEKNMLEDNYANGYAAKVATRLVISGWRKDAVRRKYAHNFQSTDQQSTNYLSDIRLDLRKALKKLSSRQRDIVSMRYLADLSEADTASALNLSVGTVKSTLHDALSRLRTMVEVKP